MSDAKLCKEALALVLDVGGGVSGPDFDAARHFCLSIIQQKMLLAPKSDELALIFAGTRTALNNINAADPTACPHVAVQRPFMAASVEAMRPVLEAAPNEDVEMDVLDAILVAADLLMSRTRDKKYQRRIYLVTSASGAVKKKNLLEEITKGLAANNVSLVVIGVNFDEVDEGDEDGSSSNVDWSVLSEKQKNERILRWLCSQLRDSGVISVSDAAAASAELRKRVVTQRTTSRCVLSIGGTIEIPVQLFTKALLTHPPTMARTTVKGDFVTERRYFSVREPDREVAPDARIKALRYGKSIIPFSDVDEAALRLPTHRSMQCLCFLPTREVPIHLLLGGTKVVTPCDGDACGQRALSAFVQGMAQLDVVMLVRFVWRENAAPVLAALMPNARKDTLYLCTLPFAEDLRMFRFRSFSEIKPTPKEVDAVDALITSMNLDEVGPVPRETFNPVVQQYYTAVAARLVDHNAPIPGLPAPLKRASCGWGEPGNVVEPIMRHAAPHLERAARLFPHRAGADTKSGDNVAKLFWFARGAGGGGPPVAAAASSSAAAGGTAGELPSKRVRHEEGSIGDSSSGGGGVVIDGASTAAVAHVTSVDPAGSFLAMVDRKDEDCVARAIFEMSEVVMKLLRGGIGDQYHARCDAAIDAMRAVCLREGEWAAFNKFLINLKHALAATGGAPRTGAGEAAHPYWADRVLARGVKLIAADECGESDLTPAQAVELLRGQPDAPAAALEMGGDDEDVFGMLE